MHEYSEQEQENQVDNLLVMLRSIKEINKQTEKHNIFSHTRLIEHLMSAGWYEHFHDSCNAYFKNDSYPLRELTVPINADLFDYNGAMLSAITKFVDCEFESKR